MNLTGERGVAVTCTAAELLVDRLIAWDVSVVFGLPGDGINGIMEALRARQDRIRFIQVRHEEAAAFMACGYAKFTGRLGVCLATSGPGGLHLLNGLYDAKLDGQPVLAITGHHFHDLIDTSAQQDVNLDRVFMDVARYSTRVMGVAHVENGVRFTIATDGPEMMRTHLRDELDLLRRIGALDGDELAQANARGHEASFVGRREPVATV